MLMLMMFVLFILWAIVLSSVNMFEIPRLTNGWMGRSQFLKGFWVYFELRSLQHLLSSLSCFKFRISQVRSTDRGMIKGN